MSSYGGSYKPFRINYSKCGKCPPPEILTDTNGNDSLSLIRTKKSRYAHIIRNKLFGARNPFRNYNLNQEAIFGLNCNSLGNNSKENSVSTSTTTNRNNQKIPVVNAFGRIEGSPYGSGSRPINRFN